MMYYCIFICIVHNVFSMGYLFCFYFVCRYHYYLQVKSDVIEGKLTCNAHQAIQLGGYCLQGQSVCLIFLGGLTKSVFDSLLFG